MKKPRRKQDAARFVANDAQKLRPEEIGHLPGIIASERRDHRNPRLRRGFHVDEGVDGLLERDAAADHLFGMQAAGLDQVEGRVISEGLDAVTAVDFQLQRNDAGHRCGRIVVFAEKQADLDVASRAGAGI